MLKRKKSNTHSKAARDKQAKNSQSAAPVAEISVPQQDESATAETTLAREDKHSLPEQQQQSLMLQFTSTQDNKPSETNEEHTQYFLQCVTLNKWDIVKEYFDKNLVTTKFLQSSWREADYICEGINAFWLLVNHQQWSMVQLCFDRNLVTTQVLQSYPTNYINTDQGINAFWLLVLHQHWSMVQICFDKNLVTTELLQSYPTHNVYYYQGVNAFWIFVLNHQWSIVQICFDKNLITNKLLQSYPRKNSCPEHGANVLWFLVGKMKWNLVQICFDKNLITTELLQSHPTHNINQGANVLLLLVGTEQWNLVQICFDKNLITTELLQSHPTHNNNINQGANMLWCLVAKRKWNLVQICFDKNLITTELLQSHPTYNNNIHQGANVLWFLVATERWSLVQICFDKNLITTELLLSYPMNKTSNWSGMNVFYMACYRKGIEVVKKSIELGLVTTDVLLSFDQHTELGLNALIIMRNDMRLNPFINLLIFEINTQLLLSLVSNQHQLSTSLLKQFLVPFQPENIKKLLDSPLAPLEKVPWNSFDTNEFMRQMLDHDMYTFFRLAELGVKFKSEILTKKCYRFTKRDDLESFQQLMTPFKSLPPPPPVDHLAKGLAPYIPSINELDYESQYSHWYWRSTQEMPGFTQSVGFIFSEMNAYFKLKMKGEAAPIALMWIILYYAVGDQHGITRGFPPALSNEKLKIGPRPLKSYGQFFEENTRKGKEFFDEVSEKKGQNFTLTISI